MPERATVSSRSEKSAEAVVATGCPGAKGRTRESGVPPPMGEAMRQKPERSGRQEREAGEARQASGLDEAERPRRGTNDTGPGLLTAVLARENLLGTEDMPRQGYGAANSSPRCTSLCNPTRMRTHVVSPGCWHGGKMCGEGEEMHGGDCCDDRLGRLSVASELELPEVAEPGASGIENGSPRSAHELQAVYNIPVIVSVVLGKATMEVSQLLKLGR